MRLLAVFREIVVKSVPPKGKGTFLNRSWTGGVDRVHAWIGGVSIMPLIECERGGVTSATALGDRSVGLVVNTFERSRNAVVTLGWFSKIEKDNRRTFD